MSPSRFHSSLTGLLLLGLLSTVWARWSHYVPAQAPVSQPLRLEFMDPEGQQAPEAARLRAELDGRALAPIEAAELAAGRVVFTIPADLLRGRELSYTAELVLAGRTQHLPEAGRWRLPLAPAEDLALVELLSSLDFAPGEEALLAFSARGDLADLSSAQVWIDGQPAPGSVEADPWLVTWRGMLTAGAHEVELRLKDRQGRDLQPQRMQLVVRDAERVPRGFEAASWQEFNMDFQDSRQTKWQRYHTGYMRFRAWRGQGEEAWNLRGRMLLSALDLESEALQPQSRLSLELTRKGLLLGLGDRQPEYGQLLLSGTRVRGAELQAEGRLAGLRFVTGRTQEARDPLFRTVPAAANPHVTDFAGAYARNLTALDLRLGRKLGLLESGLTLLKVKDDVGSIDAHPPTAWAEDSTRRVSPQDNAALALRLDMNALRGRLSARNQVAFSLYNSDITEGAWTTADLELIGADGLPDPSSFEDIIVINQYFSPMDLADKDLMNALAISSNWQLAVGANETLVDFRRVGGAFHSLGNSFLTPDRQELRLTDRFRLLQNQVYVDLGLGLSSDNLDGQYDATVGTTAGNSFSAGLGWYPRGRDLQVRLGVEQQQEANEALDLLVEGAGAEEELAARSQQIEGALTQLRLGLSGSLDWLERRHQWSLNLLSQTYGDEVGRLVGADEALLRADRSFNAGQFSLGWLVDLIPGTRLDAGFSIYGSDHDDPTLPNYGTWSLRGALGNDWLDGRLQSAVRVQLQSVTSETGNMQDTFSRTDLGGQVDWRIRQGLTLGGRLDWQGWAGDRDDSFLKAVLRMSQEF